LVEKLIDPGNVSSNASPIGRCERVASSVQPEKKTRIRIGFARFWAGATADELIETILVDLKPYFDFDVSAAPQVVLYGPYPGEMPKGSYLKVFIGCENVRPLMSECDFAFGVLHPEQVRHPRYMRFARWGEDSHLIRRDKDWAQVLRSKTRFCAFVHSHRAPYREALFRALSRYKRVDAPGRSMNNMPGIDPVPGENVWPNKIAFLRSYKFVIAFENASASGYNTEKLSHAIEADCVPIYWGDPEIGRSFNTPRFINAHDFLPKPRRLFPRLPHAPHSLRGTGRFTLAARAARKFNGFVADTEQRVFALAGFDALIERVIAADRDDELYLQYLRQAFFIGNKPPDRARWIARWREIFACAASPGSRGDATQPSP
jgi:alpha(1,3/1,4) fucosyltransferase